MSLLGYASAALSAALILGMVLAPFLGAMYLLPEYIGFPVGFVSAIFGWLMSLELLEWFDSFFINKMK